MPDFSDESSSPAPSSERLKSARLLVDRHEIFISVDEDTRNRILLEVFQEKYGLFSDASILKEFELHDKFIKERESGWAREIFRKLAVMPAGLGMIAAVAANLLATPHGMILSYRIAEILPACLALAVSLGNLAMLYCRPRV